MQLHHGRRYLYTRSHEGLTSATRQCYSCHAHTLANDRWQAACCKLQGANLVTISVTTLQASVAATSAKASLLPFTRVSHFVTN